MGKLTNFIFGGDSKITADGDYSHEIKRHLLLGRKVMTKLDSILKSRNITLSTKVCLSNQGYGFSGSHVWMWELDYKESWGPKNWCFWTVVLEKTLESPLDCKEIQPVHPKGDQSWVFIERTDIEAETPPDVKNWLIWKDPDAGKDWGQEEKEMTEDEKAGWHHWLDDRWFGWSPGVGGGQGGLVCMGSQRAGHEWLTELNSTVTHGHSCVLGYCLFITVILNIDYSKYDNKFQLLVSRVRVWKQLYVDKCLS